MTTMIGDIRVTSLDGTFNAYALAPGAFPNRIVAGPDGALWFTELRADKVGRVTPDGLLTEFPVAGGSVGITVRHGQRCGRRLPPHAVGHESDRTRDRRVEFESVRGH